ncbi:MAG: hypothetical protein CMI54_03415 [Parcubacteria group bacterium]|jgi:prevent-host-death family protein|nr:hypothetical protein [Parcubacteria group bacterium]|tara:strand:- start:638 stop:853 length:216 start_codon:yes stop_codon:yes gene_type:complete
MNLEEIKEIIKADGGKIIIVEDGEPTLVIMSFEDYKAKLKKPSLDPKTEEKNKASKDKKPTEELTLEDLPV